mmetsp:Transcript_41900/g.133735  ORF Transcript_41900/g.133735 Transcript_41900/m.133735 type:complete len:219 (+) Transcript_41900:808-1464(+)
MPFTLHPASPKNELFLLVNWKSLSNITMPLLKSMCSSPHNFFTAPQLYLRPLWKPPPPRTREGSSNTRVRKLMRIRSLFTWSCAARSMISLASSQLVKTVTKWNLSPPACSRERSRCRYSALCPMKVGTRTPASISSQSLTTVVQSSSTTCGTAPNIFVERLLTSRGSTLNRASRVARLYVAALAYESSRIDITSSMLPTLALEKRSQPVRLTPSWYA